MSINNFIKSKSIDAKELVNAYLAEKKSENTIARTKSTSVQKDDIVSVAKRMLSNKKPVVATSSAEQVETTKRPFNFSNVPEVLQKKFKLIQEGIIENPPLAKRQNRSQSSDNLEKGN